MDPRHEPSRAELLDIWQGELDTIADLASTLDDEQWSALTPCPGWTVGDLVAHLTDIEMMLAQEPRPDHEPDWASLPHATGDIGRFTEVGVDWRRGRPQEDVIDELRATTRSRRATLDSLAADETVLSPFGRPTSVERLMRVRTLDAWVHEQDIREAIGQPGGMDSDAAILTLQQFLQGLPKVWAKQAQAPAGSVVHLVVADVGRGVEAWATVDAEGQGVACDPTPDPTVTVTLTWQDYLTLSAGRAPVASVRGRIATEGDAALGEALLASMVQTP